MKWVIRRTDQGGGWLSRPLRGYEKWNKKGSYTNVLQRARTFDSREAAQAECCPENEKPESVNDIMA